MSRHFNSFVDAFVTYTDNLPSTVLWRQWAAIAAIAGVLERKVWTYTVGSNHYPNQFIWLIGPPAAGKTVLTSVVQDLWYGIKEINVAPSSASSASFVDALRAGEKRIVRPAEFVIPVQYNAVAAAINELGVFLQAYDNEMVATLTDLYDGKRYGERKRTSKIEYVLEAPCVNMLAGGTPSFLSDLLPPGAWDQGLMSRVMLIFQGGAIRPELFSDNKSDKEFFKKLLEDLKRINGAYGLISFSPEAKAAIIAWDSLGGPPIPDHPRLAGYNNRRTSKLLKLCQVACLEAGDERIVSIEHYQRALNWLLEAEEHMPEIFKALYSGGQEKIIRDLWYFCYKYVTVYKKPVPEALIYEQLIRVLPAHQVKALTEQLITAKFFTRTLDPATQNWLWMPKSKAGEPT